MKGDPHSDIHHSQTFKDKEEILKAAREKPLIMYKGTPIILTTNIRNSGGQRR